MGSWVGGAGAGWGAGGAGGGGRDGSQQFCSLRWPRRAGVCGGGWASGSEVAGRGQVRGPEPGAEAEAGGGVGPHAGLAPRSSGRRKAASHGPGAAGAGAGRPRPELRERWR